ncbi:MAG: hypothetical protein AAF491_12160, partial [Verrucomicrobiota bacterium]
DKPQKIMDRGYGSTLALPIWTEVMKAAEESYPAERIAAPSGTTDTVLCRECGLLQSNRTRFPYQMPLPGDMRPRGTCRGHGGGLFTKNRGMPQAFPITGNFDEPYPPEMGPPPEESGFGKVLRGIGRLITGGRETR